MMLRNNHKFLTHHLEGLACRHGDIISQVDRRRWKRERRNARGYVASQSEWGVALLEENGCHCWCYEDGDGIASYNHNPRLIQFYDWNNENLKIDLEKESTQCCQNTINPRRPVIVEIHKSWPLTCANKVCKIGNPWSSEFNDFQFLKRCRKCLWLTN